MSWSARLSRVLAVVVVATSFHFASAVTTTAPAVAADGSAESGIVYSKKQSAQTYRPLKCKLVRAEGEFVRAVWRGKQAIYPPEFNRRLGQIKGAARHAEAQYNKALLHFTQRPPWHPSARRQINRMLDAADGERDALFRLGYLASGNRAWARFSDWIDRANERGSMSRRAERRLGIRAPRC